MANSFCKARTLRDGCIAILNIHKYISTSACHHLIPSEDLRFEAFHRRKSMMNIKIGAAKNLFFERLQKHLENNTVNPLHMKDIETVMHLAENENEGWVAITALKRYLSQPVDEDFRFGALTLRMLHGLSLSDLALQLYNDEKCHQLFDTVTSFHIFMDLLYESGDYQHVLDVCDQQLRTSQAKLDSKLGLIPTAACLKLNTQDSLEYFVTHRQRFLDAEVQMSLQTNIIGACLALRQKNPKLAQEVILPFSKRNTLILRSLRVLIHLGLDEPVLALEELKQSHTMSYRGFHTFREVLTALSQYMHTVPVGHSHRIWSLYTELTDPEGPYVQDQEVCETSIEQYVLQPFVKQRKLQDTYKPQPRNSQSSVK